MWSPISYLVGFKTIEGAVGEVVEVLLDRINQDRVPQTRSVIRSQWLQPTDCALEVVRGWLSCRKPVQNWFALRSLGLTIITHFGLIWIKKSRSMERKRDKQGDGRQAGRRKTGRETDREA